MMNWEEQPYIQLVIFSPCFRNLPRSDVQPYFAKLPIFSVKQTLYLHSDCDLIFFMKCNNNALCLLWTDSTSPTYFINCVFVHHPDSSSSVIKIQLCTGNKMRIIQARLQTVARSIIGLVLRGCGWGFIWSTPWVREIVVVRFSRETFCVCVCVLNVKEYSGQWSIKGFNKMISFSYSECACPTSIQTHTSFYFRPCELYFVAESVKENKLLLCRNVYTSR